MDHVAIMAKNVGLIDHILSGQKTIESRWSKNKSAPYDKISVNDTVYFKDSGGLVKAKASVSQVKQFSNLTLSDSQAIVDQYGSSGQIDIQNQNVTSWANGKRYAVLIWLNNPQPVTPFNINKSGFGSGCAWITVANIDTIRMS